MVYEINIFLYFKFPELFNKYVKNNLKYKIEKTFIDYFLLDDYDTLYQYLTSFKINLLSTFELCLLLLKLININININKIQNEAEKIKNIIKSRTISKENLENHFITNFNTIINMSLNEEKINNHSNKILYEEEENLNLNEDTDNIELYYKNADPDMEVFSSEDYNGFDRKKRKENYKNALKRAEKEIGAEFEKPGNVKEYQETHYFLEKYESKDINNPLWLDFAEHIIKEKTHKNFLSKNILYNKDIRINEILYILSIIDLPINSPKHDYKKNKNSRMTLINPANNIILFNKEISESELDLNNKLLISQRVHDLYYQENNINTNNCSINIEYCYQAIVTNISNKSLNFQLFIQIPEGAIGLDITQNNNIFKILLKPYETKEYKIYFYFPKEGTFTQYYPVASKNNKIISIGNSLVYKVKKGNIPNQKIEVPEKN